MTYFGLPNELDLAINAAFVIGAAAFALFFITLPYLRRFIDREKAKNLKEYGDMIDGKIGKFEERIEEIVGNPTDIWLKSGFFSEEHAALLGKPVEYMVKEDGVEKKVQDGVWCPSRIITESVGKAVQGVLVSPETRDVLNHIARNQVMMITEKFGDNLPIMRDYEQALIETAVEQGALPEGSELEAFYLQNRKAVDSLLEGVAEKLNLPEDVGGADLMRLMSAAKNTGLLDRLQKSGGNTPRAPAPYRPKKASTGAGIR